MDPEDYQVNEIEDMWRDSSADSLAKLDTLLTYNVVKYIHDVSFGQLKPYFYDPKLFPEAGDRAFDPAATILQLLEAEDLDSAMREFPPESIQYAGLRKGLADYRSIQEQGH